MKKKSIIIISLLFYCGFISAQNDLINHENICNHIEILADDDFQGRKPGTIGEEKTTAYIADLYDGLIDGLVIDVTDAGDQVATGLPLHAEQTVMKTRADKCALAQRLLLLANLSPLAPAPDEVCA